MKIAFWSNASDMCSVTANLAAISMASVIRYPYSIITMENKQSSNNLGNAFFGRSRINLRNEVGTNYYDGGGLEGLVRKIYRGDYHSGMLGAYVTEIITDHLYYIPQSKIIHSEIFDYEFDHCIHPIIDMMENYADICFIETASHQNLSTKTILEEADLIVVNLCQKQSILEDFFLNYSSLISKAVFIISNYDFHDKFNCKRIAHSYDIPLENIIPIPINEGYQNAFINGNIIPFIYNNYQCLKENPNYFFIQSIKKASYIIIKKTVEAAKQKEKEKDLCYR